jgi:hypothetical protein
MIKCFEFIKEDTMVSIAATIDERYENNQVKQEKKSMGFVNEFASEEDIEKYDLEGLMDKYRPIYKDRQFELSQPKFTIDRERNIFFMTYRQGREEFSNRTYALLWISGKCVIVEVDLVYGSSESLSDSPFKMVWELAAFRLQEEINMPRETAINILKEALIAYGYAGARKQIPNTIVEFKSGRLSWD